MNEETVSPMKKLTKLVTHTSYQLFDSFVNDTEEHIEKITILSPAGEQERLSK